VDFAPGTQFFNHPDDGDGYLRLTFATHQPPIVKEGVKRLAKAFRRSMS
jgi:aspartate/methionine/tyrosine aminotransferase